MDEYPECEICKCQIKGDHEVTDDFGTYLGAANGFEPEELLEHRAIHLDCDYPANPQE